LLIEASALSLSSNESRTIYMRAFEPLWECACGMNKCIKEIEELHEYISLMFFLLCFNSI